MICDCDGGERAWADHRGQQPTAAAAGHLQHHQRDQPSSSPGDKIQQEWLLARLLEGEYHVSAVC